MGSLRLYYMWTMISLFVWLDLKFFFDSLKELHRKLFIGFCTEKNSGLYDKTYWHSDNEIAHAVWTLVHICSLDDANSFGDLVADFISKVVLLWALTCNSFSVLVLDVECKTLLYINFKCFCYYCDWRLALEIHTVLFSTFLGSLAVYMFLDNSIMTPLAGKIFRMSPAYLRNFWNLFWDFWESTWWIILLILLIWHHKCYG